MIMNKKYISFFLFIFIIFAFYFLYENKSALSNEVRIGYFHGGRVNKIFQAYMNGYFEEEGVNIKLYTKFLHSPELIELPDTIEQFKKLSNSRGDKDQFGKMSGIEIVAKIIDGELDGGTIGESSFVASIAKGLPIIAVAQLGYDSVPGKAILIRSDIKINSVEDLKGKTLISRRAGPGDAIFLREFLKSVNLDPEKDITVIDQVNDDKYLNEVLQNKEVDGGLYHLLGAKKLVESNVAYVYRPMDWMNSQLSHAVLVFHKDYLEKYPNNVSKIIRGYMRRVEYEKNLPDLEKDRSWDKSFMMEGEFQGMKIPKYDLPPLVRVQLLKEMQDLLFEYGEIDEKIDINKYVDNSLVEKIYEKF